MTAPQSKCVLITGAARRIGRALAFDFARHGWAVAVHYHSSKADAEAVVGDIAALGARAHAVQCDLADAGALDPLVAAAARALGPITCLINNASEFRFDSHADLNSEVWDRHLAINLKAPVFLARAFAAHLPEPHQGNVINIIDQRVWNLTPEFFSYSVSKAGLWSATRMLAQALAPRIRVNAIGPGPILQSVHQSPEDFAREAASTLLQRGSSPDEIATAVRFLLSAPAITGQMLALDGGQHLTWSNPADHTADAARVSSSD